MRTLFGWLTVLLFVLFAVEANGQGKIEWKTKYPQTSNFVGGIDVEGTIKLDTGWKLVVDKDGTAYLPIRGWRDDKFRLDKGNVIVLKATDKTDFSWGGSIGTRGAGFEHNVTVEAEVYEPSTGKKEIIVIKLGKATAYMK